MKQLVAIILSCFSFVCLAYQEKPITVIIPSYNNAQWYERNLNSVCFQNYHNYHIIYIDDCSPDGTGALVRAYIAKHNLHDKVTLICNPTNCGAMANHYKAVWMCPDDMIIVHLDGDDFLKHNNVLARINREYQNPHVWLTYGQFERFPDGNIGYCRDMPLPIIQRNIFREYEWITSHLRTFYAGLFKQIKLRDFVYDGNYFDITCDMAMMFPLLELAGTHMRFISDVLYVYNEATPINDYKKNVVRQLHCEKVIRSRTKYQPASSYTVTKRIADPIDMVLFSLDAQSAESVLAQIKDSAEPINSVTVFYRADHAASFVALRLAYAEHGFVSFYPESGMQQFFEDTAEAPGYYVLAAGPFVLTGSMALAQAVTALEAARAISFNVALGATSTRTPLLVRQQNIPSLVTTPEGCYAWQFANAEHDWRQPFACTMNVCRKSDIARLLAGARYNNWAELQQILQLSATDFNDTGLCYPHSRVTFVG